MNNLTNEDLVFYTILLGIFFIGYLMGNISPAYLFGKWFGRLDIRKFGSGNAGTTNVFRVMGWKYGVPVFVLDAVKGLSAAAVGSALGGVWGATAAALGAVIGHDLPVFLDFRGGKGIALTIGIFLYLFPGPTLIGIGGLILLILITRMVSAGSLVFMISFFLFTTISHQTSALVILSSSLAIFAIIRHLDNIKRILKGVENKISFGRRQEKTPS